MSNANYVLHDKPFKMKMTGIFLVVIGAVSMGLIFLLSYVKLGGESQIIYSGDWLSDFAEILGMSTIAAGALTGSLGTVIIGIIILALAKLGGG